MRTKIHIILALTAVMLLWTGCANEPTENRRAIKFACGSEKTRAQETTTKSMESFRVSAIWARQSGEYELDFMDEQLVSKNSNGDWEYSPVRYMPANDGTVDFFAYSPADAGVKKFEITGTKHDQVKITYDQTTDLAMQRDFMVAENLEKTSAPVFLNFRHMLTSLRIEARTTVQNLGIIEVKLINLYRQGVLTGTTSSAPGKATTWTWESLSRKATYSFFPEDYIPINKYYTYVTEPENPIMILPQTVNKAPYITHQPPIGGDAYIAVFYNTFDGNGPTVDQDFVEYIPICGENSSEESLTFEVGKKYVFKVDVIYNPANPARLEASSEQSATPSVSAKLSIETEE